VFAALRGMTATEFDQHLLQDIDRKRHGGC
jgi:hypothetical protein